MSQLAFKVEDTCLCCWCAAPGAGVEASLQAWEGPHRRLAWPGPEEKAQQKGAATLRLTYLEGARFQ